MSGIGFLHQDFLEQLPAAVCVYDSDGTITGYNQRALRLWGRTSQGALSVEARSCGAGVKLEISHFNILAKGMVQSMAA